VSFLAAALMPQSLYKLRVPDAAAKLIRGLHPQLKRKCKASLRRILEEPAVGKALHAELEGLWSYPVGRFRIVYRFSRNPRIVELVAMGSRERIYEETLRLVRREQDN